MGFNGVVYAGDLGGINVAAAASLTVIKPVLSSIDASLFGPLGLGALRDNLQAQLSASLQAQASLALGIANPLGGFEDALRAATQLQAQLAQALSMGSIPAVSLEVTTQLSVMSSFAAAAGAQIGNLQALLQQMLDSKIPAMSFAGSLFTSLQAGGAFLLSFDGVSLSSVGSSIASSFAGGISYGPSAIGPSDAVYGIVLLTKVPSTWTAIQAILRT